MDHLYNQRNISPKMFLLEVMWAADVEMANRIAAANALTHWIERRPVTSVRLTSATLFRSRNSSRTRP